MRKITYNSLVAKTFEGLESVLAKELEALGAEDIEISRRAVRFSGSMELVYKANLRLRTALRILINVHQFRADTEKDLRHIIEHGSKHYEIDELNNRFDFAKKYIMQSSKNFAPEILHVFQENIRKKDYIVFIPLNSTFTIYNQYTPQILKIFDAILAKQAAKEEGITENQKAENISVGKTDKTKVESQSPKPTTISSRNTATLPHTSIKSAEKELKAKQSKYENNNSFNIESFSSKKQPIRPQLVEQLEEGDILMETIKNKFGGVMVKEGTVLSARTIALLNDMAKKEAIPNQVIINNQTVK